MKRETGYASDSTGVCSTQYRCDRCLARWWDPENFATSDSNIRVRTEWRFDEPPADDSGSVLKGFGLGFVISLALWAAIFAIIAAALRLAH